MDTWTVVEAKAKFSEMMDKARDSGPQTITRNGKPAAVLVSVEEWKRKSKRKGTLVEFFASSPLVDSGIVIERVRSEPRDIDL